MIDRPLSASGGTLRAGWPTMPTAFRPGPAGYAARFADGWFRTGTRVRRSGDRWVLPPGAGTRRPSTALSG